MKNLKMNIFLLLAIIYITPLMIISIFPNYNVRNIYKSNLNDENLRKSSVSGKFHINNNWTDVKTAGICTGEGTESDPYIIENLVIDGGGLGNCILIENSDVFFKIQYCVFNNTGDEYYDAGVKLIDVDNGQLLNNNASGDAFGFYLNRSNNNIIVGNRLTGKGGLYHGICEGNIIYLNNFNGKLMDMFILTKDESSYRFYSPKKATYKYEGNTYKKYLGNYWSGFSRISDDNDDGIGDEPQIYYDSYELLIDKYPLLEPIENYEIVKFSGDSGGVIPSYNLFFLIGLVSISSIVILSKLNKTIKQN